MLKKDPSTQPEMLCPDETPLGPVFIEDDNPDSAGSPEGTAAKVKTLPLVTKTKLIEPIVAHTGTVIPSDGDWPITIGLVPIAVETELVKTQFQLDDMRVKAEARVPMEIPIVGGLRVAAPMDGELVEKELLDLNNWWAQVTSDVKPAGLVAAITQARTVEHTEWRSKQLSDPQCKDWEARAEQGDDLHYQVKGGLLYRRTISNELHENREPTKDWKVVVPDALVLDLFQQYHDHSDAGHSDLFF